MHNKKRRNYMIKESLIQKGLRKKLVDRLRSRNIVDERVLEAIGKIPRHLFIDSGLINHAYEDKPFSIGCGQTISQPYTVAFQTQLLQLKKGDKVLEIGTGSGYQAAVLAEMGADVCTIERRRELFIRSQRVLRLLGYSVRAFWGDGYEGKEAYAPFNKIIITAGIPEIPEKLLKQLTVNGVLAAPVGVDNQKMISIVRLSETIFGEPVDHGDYMFVPMLKGVC